MAIGLTFKPDIPTFTGLRSKFIYTALSGGNNTGKSAVLKNIKQHLGRPAYLVGPMRFYHIHQIANMQRDPNELEQLEHQFQSSFYQPEVNHEQNFLDLGRVIANLSNNNRAKLFEVCGELLGSKFSLKRVDPDNELSMSYVDMDGQSLGLGSTGTRLLMTLIGICMDTRFNTILIDEPELGLSPKVQEAFASFLQDETRRTEMFPHLSAVYVATHSHLFLDKSEPTNNFIVSRDNTTVSIDSVSTVSELHRLQFNLLGNSLEKISLPSAILITEGPSDYDYLKRIVELRFPDKRITVVSGLGDVKKKVHSIKEMLGGDLQKSPYRDRLFVVVDSVHPDGLSNQLKQMGVLASNLVIWAKNGIEYLYPNEILAQLFNTAGTNIDSEIRIANDEVTVRDVTIRKVELAQIVVPRLSETTVLPEELITKLIDPLGSAVN
ncbi:MAG TPA: hypothetical protein VK978_01645 [Candidatus Saccharimonadales bacterium]|nr:hypothetical protein [Candidatus Saccharimonadales bacterium]